MFATLHTYFRSSASYRVRIALNLKGVETQHVAILKSALGEQPIENAFIM